MLKVKSDSLNVVKGFFSQHELSPSIRYKICVIWLKPQIDVHITPRHESQMRKHLLVLYCLNEDLLKLKVLFLIWLVQAVLHTCQNHQADKEEHRRELKVYQWLWRLVVVDSFFHIFYILVLGLACTGWCWTDTRCIQYRIFIVAAWLNINVNVQVYFWIIFDQVFLCNVHWLCFLLVSVVDIRW